MEREGNNLFLPLLRARLIYSTSTTKERKGSKREIKNKFFISHHPLFHGSLRPSPESLHAPQILILELVFFLLLARRVATRQEVRRQARRTQCTNLTRYTYLVRSWGSVVGSQREREGGAVGARVDGGCKSGVEGLLTGRLLAGDWLRRARGGPSAGGRGSARASCGTQLLLLLLLSARSWCVEFTSALHGLPCFSQRRVLIPC